MTPSRPDPASRSREVRRVLFRVLLLNLAVVAEDVPASHAIADEVELRVSRALHAREVVVHVEPAG